ncbi:uncharacterized protein METZ01_LOCUS155344 [marine metagenome]|uniref:YHS domain-containing protein n=1 Tax=marine metagenome TaxID=408172 RepID=A0A382ALT5_9ZZZZ
MKRFYKAMSIILVAMVSLNAGDKDKKKHEVTCVVSGETIDETEYSNYKKGKVYFCCGGCKADFDEASATFAVAANYQLVATGQYMQTNCPVSGRGLNPEKVVKVANSDVTFCCGNCQGKTNKAEDKMAFIFADVSFDKGFFPVPEKPESNKNTNKDKK